MKIIGLPIVIFAVSASARAQFLSTSVSASVLGSNGSEVNTSQKSGSYLAGDSLTRSVSASTPLGQASTSFTSSFGLLSSSASTSLSRDPISSASAVASGNDFRGFAIGAVFGDSLTLSGTGFIQLTVHFRLTTDISASGNALSSSILFVGTNNAFNNSVTNDALGTTTSSGTISISGNNGDVVQLGGYLGSFARSDSFPFGPTDLAVASNRSVGEFWITPVQGNFTAVSGSRYLEPAPVPEPATLATLAVGVLALRRRRTQKS